MCFYGEGLGWFFISELIEYSFYIQAETVMGTCTICKQQIRMIKNNEQVCILHIVTAPFTGKNFQIETTKNISYKMLLISTISIF